MDRKTSTIARLRNYALEYNNDLIVPIESWAVGLPVSFEHRKHMDEVLSLLDRAEAYAQERCREMMSTIEKHGTVENRGMEMYLLVPYERLYDIAAKYINKGE